MKKIITLLILLFSINSIFADDSRIRAGIYDALYGPVPQYISKINNNDTRLGNLAENKWQYINKTLNEILSWSHIPGFHVIFSPVTGRLQSEGQVGRADADKIALGVQEFAKGGR